MDRSSSVAGDFASPGNCHSIGELSRISPVRFWARQPGDNGARLLFRFAIPWKDLVILSRESCLSLMRSISKRVSYGNVESESDFKRSHFGC